eukprot:5519778-Pleurochrysis_carterae.AAC.1
MQASLACMSECVRCRCSSSAAVSAGSSSACNSTARTCEIRRSSCTSRRETPSPRAATPSAPASTSTHAPVRTQALSGSGGRGEIWGPVGALWRAFAVTVAAILALVCAHVAFASFLRFHESGGAMRTQAVAAVQRNGSGRKGMSEEGAELGDIEGGRGRRRAFSFAAPRKFLWRAFAFEPQTEHLSSLVVFSTNVLTCRLQ